MISTITSIGLSIDGGYYCKINDGLYQSGYRLSLEKLQKYIRECIAEKFGLDASQCLSTESHFYRGRFRMPDARKKKRLEADRDFEDSLIENDVVIITGDADHETLARKIKALKKHVVLVTWDMAEKDSTSPALKDEVTMHIDLDALSKADASIFDMICDKL